MSIVTGQSLWPADWLHAAKQIQTRSGERRAGVHEAMSHDMFTPVMRSLWQGA